MSIVSRNRPPFGDDGEAIIFVGEVATVGFRLTDANGAVQSYAGRTFGLQVYLDGGTNKINVNGALTSHADGDYIQCALTEDETDLLTAGTLYGWGFVEYTADGPIVVCGGVVRAAAGATAAQASGAPGSGIGGITLYTLRIDTGIVTVTYMGAPGAGVLPGGTDGQFLVKDGASDYSTEWVTLGITHVSGLSATLSTLTLADVSLTSRISTEEVTRGSADTSLTTRLSGEEVTRASADTSLTTRLSSEEVVRASVDTSLTTRLSTEEATRSTADTSLTTRLSNEEVTRAAADTSLTSRLSTEEAARISGDASLASALSSGDTSLTTRVSTEEGVRVSGDTSLTSRVSTEEVARAAADTSLTSRISTEESTRGTADTSLTTRLSTEEGARASADTSIVSRFSTADVTLATADTSLTTRLSTEEVTRGSADTSLTTRVSTEETTRASADTSLATAAAATYLPFSGGTMAGVLAVIAGTAALPGLAVAGDLNTGIYGVSADVLGVSAGGLNAASFSNGQLSLATAAGGAGVNLAVDAANVLALRNGTSAQAFRVYNSSANSNTDYNRASFGWSSNIFRLITEEGGADAASPRQMIVGTSGLASFSVMTNATTRWNFLSDGRLSPHVDNTYDIGGGSNRARYVYAATAFLAALGSVSLPTYSFSGDLNTGMWSPAADTLAWSTGGSERVRIDSSGNVGIGTTSPSAKLDVVGDAILSSPGAKLTFVKSISSEVAALEFKHTSGTGGSRIVFNGSAAQALIVDIDYNNASNFDAFSIRANGSTTRFHIDNSGNVGIGTASPSTLLHVAGVTTLGGNLLASADATYDLGLSGSGRFRDGWFSRDVTAGSLTATGNLSVGTAGAHATDYGITINSGSYTASDGFISFKNGVGATEFARINMSPNGPLAIGTSVAVGLEFKTNNINRLSIDSGGHLVPGADATYDLGASGANRFRDAFLSRSMMIGGTAPAAASLSAIQSFGRSYSLIGGTSVTDVTVKTTAIGALHYAAASAPMTMMYSVSSLSANTLNIGGGIAAGNAATLISIYTGATTTTATGTQRWLWYSGHYLAAADNTYDIGASGANRPRVIYAGTEINCAATVTAGVTGDFRYQGSTRIRNVSDGVITLLNNAASDFSRLQFGGTTSAFPALKRDGIGLRVRLADDSGSGDFFCATLTANASTAMPAGGTTGTGLKVSTTTNFGVFFGSGAPTLSAAKGSLYLRSDGSGTSDRMYVNTDGGTTWTAVTTAA